MRWTWLNLLFLLALGVSLHAADPEAEAFDRAAGAFNTKFYERAENDFDSFIKEFPSSTNRARAVLFQAQSRHFLKKYDGAVQLLDENLPQAGPLADQYVFWKGEALREKGDHPAAAAAFAKVISDYPESPLRLEAAVKQALSVYRQNDPAKTIELLSSPEGSFQKLAGPELTNTNAVHGTLLLAEALLATNRLDEALGALQRIPPLPDTPELDWERHFLIGRVGLASTNPATALPPLTNAVAVAQKAQRPLRLAEALNLEAEVYKKLQQPAQAVASYRKISAEEIIPLDQRRLALLKTVELLSAENQLTNAVASIEGYLGANPAEPSADLLRVKAGELWVAEFQNRNRNGAVDRVTITNMLGAARAHFQQVITQFTNSPHLGKAYLNLGWSLWEEAQALNSTNRMQESQAAFESAIEKLTRSDEQAMAKYKLGDTLFHLKNFPAAATNYAAVIENYADLPQARSGLFDRAYRQLVLTFIELKDLDRAASYLAELRKAFPNSSRTEEALFAYGRGLANVTRHAEAREVFEDFIKTYPQSALVPEVRFAIAKSFAAEGKWPDAIGVHESWLGAYTNHFLLPQVHFDRALLNHLAGNATNAFNLFTNFVTRFPANPLAPVAQNWVADFFAEQERWAVAEQHYQRVFQNTNWAGNPITYHSRKMAAQMAFLRQGYSDARSYLTNLINDPACPADLKPEAWFILGDVIIEQPITGSTNKLFNYMEASNVYDQITKLYPSNRLAILAWGKRGDCHLQLASEYPESYGHATNSYQMVLQLKRPDTPVSVLNQAETGLGKVYESMAESRKGAEREALLKQSLKHYLNVVYSEAPDPAFLKIAGSSAGRVAEALGEREAALELYRRLLKDLPALKTTWESRIESLEKTLAAAPTLSPPGL